MCVCVFVLYTYICIQHIQCDNFILSCISVAWGGLLSCRTSQADRWRLRSDAMLVDPYDAGGPLRIVRICIARIDALIALLLDTRWADLGLRAGDADRGGRAGLATTRSALAEPTGRTSTFQSGPVDVSCSRCRFV